MCPVVVKLEAEKNALERELEYLKEQRANLSAQLHTAEDRVADLQDDNNVVELLRTLQNTVENIPTSK